MEKVIEIKGLQKSFGKRQVLKNINIDINKGERVAIIGNNGEGKSTLIKILLGLMKFDEGKINFPYNKNLKGFQKNTSVQFQEGSFPLNYKVKEIIDIISEQKGNFKLKEYKKWKENEQKVIDELIDVFEIKKILNQKVNSLSGGEKQRLNVLLSILNKPETLILDEISTGLDIRSQENLISFIKDHCDKNNITLIIISHIIFEIETLTDKILILEDGIIKFELEINKLNEKYGSLSNSLHKYFVEGKDISK